MPCIELLGVEICIPSLDDIYNSVTAPLTTWITSQVTWVWNQISPQLTVINAAVGGVAAAVISEVTVLFQDPLNYMQTKLDSVGLDVTMIGPLIFEATAGIIPAVQNGVADLSAEFWTGVGDLTLTVGTSIEGLGVSFAGLLDTAQNTLITQFDGAFGLVGDVISGVFKGFGVVNVDAAASSVQSIALSMGTVLTTGPRLSSPMTPEEALLNTDRWRDTQRDYWYQLYMTGLLIEGGSLGQIETHVTMQFQEPQIRASLDLAAEWYRAPYDIGIRPLLQRFWLKSYQPLLPSYADMIEVYVKEGYLPEKWVELPAEFTANMMELGYSADWTKRLWGKHWVLPAVDHLYEMHARTLGTRPDIEVDMDLLSKMLKYHDYEPEWRARFEAIIWKTWRIYDLRVGWEMGFYDHDELVKRTIDARYSPEEAPIIADIQKMFVLRSEIDKLLAEADTDFIDGWIDEATLRSDYAATPYRPEIQEMRIQRAILRRDREVKKEIAAALKDRFIKGDLTASEYSSELRKLGMVSDQITVAVQRAAAYKLKKVPEAA